MRTANNRKSIFITGAASGMGRETAHLFWQKGWFVGAYDVNAERLRALEAELGADNCVVQRVCGELLILGKSVIRHTQVWSCNRSRPSLSSI